MGLDLDLPSFATGLAAGLCLAAIFAWSRKSRDLPPPLAARRDPGLEPAREREIRELVARGQKIEAIKLVRETTGCGLKEANDQVEAMGRPSA